LIFVSGDPGTGKTALTETLLHQVADGQQVHVGIGQCFEQFGAGEAYLPVLDALGRLGRGPGREPLQQVLAAHAPTWLAHLPELKSANGSVPVAASPDRMLREMAEALEQFTAELPLILVLEDLHWSDYSTLDLISAIARRREPARLMILATFRPSDVILSGHPLRAVKQDLQARGLCHELPLRLLSEEAVADYLQARCPGGGLPVGLPRMLHQRTEGQPLFLVKVVDDWLHQGLIVADESGWELKANVDALAVEIPASIRALIQKQIERLSPPELRTLEGASVAGIEFIATATAAALEEDPESVEEHCEALLHRHRFLVSRGSTEWPDGTLSARYRFGHELLHRVVTEGISPARRRRMHQRIAERLESAHAGNANDVAAELALHFEQGADPAKAVHYLESAARRAAGLYTHREALDYIRRALTALERVPQAERLAPEARLQLQLGLQVQFTKGFADPQARRAFTIARDLCVKTGDSSLHFPALWGLWLYHKVRSELPKAGVMARELFDLAQRLGDPSLELQSHQALAVTALCSGDPVATRQHMDQGLALYDPGRHESHTLKYGQDPGVACRAFGALALWLLGYPDQAVQVSREALRLSHKLTQPSSQALALHFAAMVHQCRRDGPAALNCADLALTIAAEHEHSFWQAGATVMRGWAVAECGDGVKGTALMRQGLESWQSTGSLTYRTYYLALLAEALGRNGQVDEGLSLLNEALGLVEETSERLFEAELHRLRGELLLLRSKEASDAVRREAEACFRTAHTIATKQQAKLLELRALLGLWKVADSAARRKTIKSQLASTLARFKEGWDTRDLQEAAAIGDLTLGKR
jgi:predicted ATPase